MKYQIEYVQHDRPVPHSQVLDYGRLATHDIRVPILLLYAKGLTQDANGKVVDINEEFITETMEITNKEILNRHKNPLAKFISKWKKPIEETTLIPISKDHDTKTVDKKIGHIEGLTFIEYLSGDWDGNGKITEKCCLFGMGLITKLEGKIDVDSEILRETSIGTRGNGSIKEVSMVLNEALPLCGLMFSEPDFVKNNKESLELEEKSEKKSPKPRKNNKLSNKEIQLSELQLAESELEHITIPNHIILARMIKTGKMKPYQYDKAIKMDRSVLEFMEQTIPARELGLTFGTNKQPQNIKSEDFKFNQLMADAKKQLGIEDDKPKQFEMIRQDFNFEEQRSKELKCMLELAEGSPELIKQYIKYELGEEVVEPSYSDECLGKYLAELSEIKQKLKSLQFGE